MMQTFQCSACGNQNAFGEPVCSHCGQPFVYNCPICGIHINNTYDRCRGCGAVFYWGKTPQQNVVDTLAAPPAVENPQFNSPLQQNPQPFVPLVPPPDRLQQTPYNVGATAQQQNPRPSYSRSGSLLSSTKFWLILIVVCIALIAIILVIDRLINN